MKPTKKQWSTAIASANSIPSIHELTSSPLDAGLWCLYVSKNFLKENYLTLEEIGDVLQDFLDIPIDEKTLKKAFARVGKRVILEKTGFGLKLSKPGEDYLEGLKKDEPLHVFYVNPDKPRTTRKNLEGIIKSLPKDHIMICDPYYGVHTLEILEVFASHHLSVKFLTLKLGGGEKQTNFDRALEDLKKEHGKKVEIKIASSRDLHDRYVIGKSHLLIIGHGIKDLGSKESLIVVVEDKYGKDLRKIVTSNFLDRWKVATPL